MKWLWISTPVFTVMVDVDSNGRITRAAPIVGKFIGQTYKSLLSWCYNKWPTEIQYYE